MSASLLPSANADPVALADALVGTGGLPVDAWAVVALLESEGWRDCDAGDGYDDLFDLGAAVYAAAVSLPVAARSGEAPASTVGATLAEAVRSYALGLTYSLPVVGQVVALVWLGYSLWASVTFSPSLATLVGIGTVGSFVFTGGLVQAMARETSRLLGAGLRGQARRVGFRFWAWSAFAVVVAGAAFWLGNLIIPFYPPLLAAVGALYFVLLGLLWVTVGLLYVQERVVAVGVVTLLGVLPVVWAIEVRGWPIVAAQVLGLSCAVAAAWAWAWATLGRGSDAADGPAPPLPRLSTVVHTTLPFAAYGALYFSFLFTDRLVAWTAPAADPLPFVVWFRTTYELGMDWSLVVLFPLLALNPFAVRRLTTGLRDAVDGPVEGATQRFLNEYVRHAASVAVLGVLAVGAVWWGGLWVGAAGPDLLRTMVNSPASRLVYLIAAPGYVLFALGLLNALVFLSEGRPAAVLRPLAFGIAADLVVGIAASRALGAEFAAVGLLAGAATFAVATTLRMVALARTADHLTYAAY